MHLVLTYSLILFHLINFSEPGICKVEIQGWKFSKKKKKSRIRFFFLEILYNMKIKY